MRCPVLGTLIPLFCKLNFVVMSFFTRGIGYYDFFKRPGFWIIREYENKP